MKLKTLKNEVLQNAPFLNTLLTIEIGDAVALIWYLRGFEVMFNHRHMEKSVFVLKISFKFITPTPKSLLGHHFYLYLWCNRKECKFRFLHDITKKFDMLQCK